jgi:hypothetical protein
MELYDLIPKKYKHLNDKWLVKSNTVMFKNYNFIPLFFRSDDNTIYIYLDLRLKKQVIELTKELDKKGYNFFFTVPEFSKPSGVIDLKNKVITNYLIRYADTYFYENFNKINFDLIKNMVDWSIKNDCYHLIKSNFDIVLKKVYRKDYDYYSRRENYRYPIEIRNSFDTLYRDIQINQIL